MSRRLLLFNSGYYARHFANVLNTLAFPAGTLNEYRYVAVGAAAHVHPSAAPGAVAEGTPCTIVFIDRWGAGGYRFVPLRHGTLRRTELDGELQYFRVSLEEYAALPSDLEALQRELRAALAPVQGPALAGDPRNDRDGNYAVAIPAPGSLAVAPGCASDRWDAIARALAQTRVFQEQLDGVPVFTRISITDSAGRPVKVTGRGRASAASAGLVRGERYSLDVAYRFPAHVAVHGRGPHLVVEPGDNLRLLGPSRLMLDAPANRESVPISFKRFSEEDEGNVVLGAAWKDPQDQPPLVVASLPVILRARASSRFVPWMAVSVLLFGLGALGLGLSWEDVRTSWATGQVWGAISMKVLGAGFQVVAAVIALRALGDKLL